MSLWLLLVGTAYVLTARLNQTVFFRTAPAGLVWVPSAVLVSAFIVAPRKYWLSLFAVAVVAHVVSVGAFTPPWRLAWQIVSFVGFAAITAETLRRFIRGPIRFDRTREVSIYTGVVLALAALVALIAPAFVLALVGAERFFAPWVAYERIALMNIVPLLILTPAIVLCAQFDLASLKDVPGRRLLEVALIFVFVFVASAIAFDAGPKLAGFPWLPLLTISPLLLAAVRLGPTGASASLVCMAVVSIWGATRQLGPFVVPPNTDALLALEICWIMISLPVMLLAAAIREREVVEAALNLQRSRLAHASRMATAGELSANLAHELRQPLAAILANAQAVLLLLANERADLAHVREIVQDIARQDRHAGEVIARLRALLGRNTPRQEPLVLESVVGDAVSLTSHAAVAAKVRVETEVATGLPPVRGDQSQLLQLLVNLLVNGCESMTGAEAGARVLRLRVGRAGPDRLEVAVVDSGVGLPADAGARLFDPFFTTKKSGLGLGLSISRSIADAHGGRLWAENNAGREGATFHLELPA